MIGDSDAQFFVHLLNVVASFNKALQKCCKMQLMERDSLGGAVLHLSRYIRKHYIMQTSLEWTSVP